MKHTLISGSSINTADAFATRPSNKGFRVPTQENIPLSEHIRRDGHLPSTFNPQARFGFEEGEIIDSAQFSDCPVAQKEKTTSQSDNVWDFPSRPSTLSNHQFAKPFSISSQGKGKEKEVVAPYAATAGTLSNRWEESSESTDYDDEAEAQDGYMRSKLTRRRILMLSRH
jgi:hypothetical protein